MIGFDIAAFICEPVQGEAGAIVPPDDYLPRVREICTEWDVVFIADEVQTGMGRTGKLWGVDNWDVAPDIMTMGKAFGGAVIPCGNIVVTERVFHAMFANPYLHTTTFGGNPLATAAAIGALHATLEEDIPGQAAEKGAYLKARVEELAAEYPDLFDEVRGMGLLLGMEFKSAEIGYAVSVRPVRQRRARGRHPEQRQDAAPRAAGGDLAGAARRGARPARARPRRRCATSWSATGSSPTERRFPSDATKGAGGGAFRAPRPPPCTARPRPCSRGCGALTHQSEKPVLYQSLLGALLGALVPGLGLGLGLDARQELVAAVLDVLPLLGVKAGDLSTCSLTRPKLVVAVYQKPQSSPKRLAM